MFLVDSNVLIDIATNDPVWWHWSSARLAECQARGTVVTNPIVYAEVCCSFKTEPEVSSSFSGLPSASSLCPTRRLFQPLRLFSHTRSVVAQGHRPFLTSSSVRMLKSKATH
jgi:hypothetical protein